jgi:hypothetical protein
VGHILEGVVGAGLRPTVRTGIRAGDTVLNGRCLPSRRNAQGNYVPAVSASDLRQQQCAASMTF